MATSNNNPSVFRSSGSHSQPLVDARHIEDATAHMSNTPKILAVMGDISVNFAGQISDFSLVPDGGSRENFKFLKYPTSCRASLNQIFMDILTAWQETNYNINSLARVQSKVPKYVEEAINLIQENDDQSMELFLDEVFMNIEKAAKRSSQLADLNVTKLEEVADTMTEMANATEEKIGHSLKTTDALQNEREKYEKKKEQTNKKIQELTEKLADLLSLYYNFGLGSVIALTQCSL